MAIALLFVVTSCRTDSRPGYIQVQDQGNDDTSLKVIHYGPVEESSVDVSGLDVDIDCAKSHRFSEGSDVRIGLLSAGCAEISTSTPTDADQAAQAEAQAKKVGRWDDSDFAKFMDVLDKARTAIWKWTVENWVAAFGIVSGLIGIIGTFWFLRAFYNKRIITFLLGPPSVGKTDLWLAWRNGSAPASNSIPTTGRSNAQTVLPITFGKYTLSPEVIDAAGSEPHHAFDEFRRARFKARWKRKLLLVMVLSPRPENRVALGGGDVDMSYVDEQRGYVSLVGAVVGGKRKRATPDAVVVFVSKFDLVSDHPPNDSASDSQRAMIEANFAEHRSRIEGFCSKADVPVYWIIGSAKRGWGIPELRESIQRIVS
jgi:hypothetical protein